MTVVWTAPDGVTGITSYDLRFILTSAEETVAANWTLVKDVWAGGPLHFVLFGLTDDAGYDLQVRAVSGTDGSWSATVEGMPREPGDTFDTAATLPLDIPLGGDIDLRPGEIDVTKDLDIFTFRLTEETEVILHTRGLTNTVGLLAGGNGTPITANDDGGLVGEPHNFLIGRTLGAGTYYLQVMLYHVGATPGPYVVWARTVADTTGISDAEEVEVGGFRNGLIDPERDEDYFKFTLTTERDLLLYTAGSVTDTVGELLESNGSTLARNYDGFVLRRPRQFLIRRKLAAGTYYVKVRAYSEVGPYSFHVETVTTEPGSAIADALPLGFGELGAGRIDPSSDADYFKIELSGATHVFARAVSNTVDIDGALLDDMGEAVATNLFEQDFPFDGPMGFTLSDRLDAGTHYIKITRSGGDNTGGYVIRMFEDVFMNEAVADCSALTAPFSDPLSGCQWNLKNTGQLGGASGQDIRVEGVWTDGNMGAGIGVAIVDGDLHEGHPDLTENVDSARGHDYSAARGRFAQPLQCSRYGGGRRHRGAGQHTRWSGSGAARDGLRVQPAAVPSRRERGRRDDPQHGDDRGVEQQLGIP